jgi:hypothetical protein
MLDVADASIDDGANIQQFSYHGGDNQRWQLRFKRCGFRPGGTPREVLSC